MATHPDLRLLFATDLSQACFRAGRDVSRLAARCHVDVTFVHVRSQGVPALLAEKALRGFVVRLNPSYTHRPLLLDGPDPAQAVADLCTRSRFDLIVAPPSDETSLARVFGRSFRAGLLRRCAVPVWSGGPGVAPPEADLPFAAVGCVVDFEDAPERHLRRASAFARRLGARLHVVSLLPVIDDSTIGRVASRAPITPDGAIDAIRAMLPASALASVDVAVDDGRARLDRMLSRYALDVVFVGRQQWVSAFWPARYPRHLDRLAYPVVCLGGTPASAAWSFQETAAWVPPMAGAPAATAASR